MTKYVHDDVLDGAFEVLDQGDLQVACSAFPATRAEAISFALAQAAMTPNTDYSVVNGDVSGRKCVMAAKANETVDVSGTATHVVIVDATRLLYVNECVSQVLTANNAVSFPSWGVELQDAA